jgi:type I restriction enzyme, S subunit
VTDIAALVADNLNLWISAIVRKPKAGRGGGKKLSLYGFDQLRTLILDLAIQGKLVPQDTQDKPAADTLREIAKARRQKVEAGLARKPKAIAPLPVNLPTLPKGWSWTQLGEVAEISPTNSADDDREASFIPMTMVSTSISGEHQSEIRKWGEIKKGFTQFANGDIGLAKITPCFENGKAALFQDLKNGIGAGTTELHVGRPWSDDINRRYLLLTMKTGSYLANGEKQMTGTAGQKRVTRTYFEASPLPLPPLAEQHRIVAKTDELMALCETLKARISDAAETQKHLADAIVERATA